MGNSITHDDNGNRAAYRRNTKHNIKNKNSSTNRLSYDENYYKNEGADYELKSKTLPTRHSRTAQRVNSHPNSQPNVAPTTPPPQTSRVLFLLYLIHRTWNVMVDTIDTRNKKSRRRTHKQVDDNFIIANAAQHGSNGFDTTISISDIDHLDDNSSFCCSQYSFCTCSYCYATNIPQNVYNSIADDNCSLDSMACER